MSANIFNLAHPLRTGHIKLAASGKELFGTVINAGKNRKTVTVSFSLTKRTGACLKIPFQP